MFCTFSFTEGRGKFFGTDWGFPLPSRSRPNWSSIDWTSILFIPVERRSLTCWKFKSYHLPTDTHSTYTHMHTHPHDAQTHTHKHAVNTSDMLEAKTVWGSADLIRFYLKTGSFLYMYSKQSCSEFETCSSSCRLKIKFSNSFQIHL